MEYKKFSTGLVVTGNAFSAEVQELVDCEFSYNEKDMFNKPSFPLTICDPPYGRIVKTQWDAVSDYRKWMKLCARTAAKNATICMWGGTGKPQDRPFIQFVADVETLFPDWQIKNWITWSKKRAYGVEDNYLYTREECLILTRGKPTFNIPLLDTKRGYAGYNKKYPAKSEYLRRTNVWTDITEMFKGKIHPTQKPVELYEVLISTHSNPGDTVYDPCAGSLTTMRACEKLGRRFCCIEREKEYVDKALGNSEIEVEI